ncbi:hypothetical protein QTO34_017789 [Cnephaeus nilssonii]|uniref:Taste receptor type 2 n=1 Tax=Cnephaeus nilssonii TaxID=3371016 RepID=A0AA40LRK6_CNENI|nr:hypothetical protein QTO34_017789 [Eptesicus nilssonii]
MEMNDYEGNITWKTKLRDIMHLSSMTVITLANFIPFTMSLTAVLLLIFSLWKHLKKMQLSGKGSQDPSTKVHIRAMQTVISFLLLFVISFLAQIIAIWRSIIQQNNSDSHAFPFVDPDLGEQKVKTGLSVISVAAEVLAEGKEINMISLLQKLFSMLMMTEFVLGNFANGFIALVNCIDWVKKHKVSCTDRILTALAVSRIGLLWTIVFNWYGTVFNLPFYSSDVRLIVYFAWIVNHHFCLWLAASLSILYLLKIANFSCLLFLHLKWRAERVVIMILAKHSCKNGNNDYEGNITWETKLRDIMHLSSMTVITLANFIPFTMSLTAVLLLIFSLWKHVKKMQLSGKGSQDPSTEVHIKAMQTVISFLLLFFIDFLAQIISIWSSTAMQNISFLMLCEVLGILQPSAHSLILIWGNKKLRQAFLSFLWQLRCWLRKGK